MSNEYPVAVSIRGPQASGKSSLAASWPGKKFWLDLEQGAIRAMNQIPDWRDTNKLWHPNHEFPEDTMKEIAIAQLTMSAMGRVQGYIPLWEEIVEKFVDVCIAGEYQVISIDTWKLVWNTNSQAHLQFMQEHPSKSEAERGDFHKRLTQRDFGTPNARMFSMLQTAKGLKRDIMLISHETDVYGPMQNAKGGIDSEEGPTGEMKLDGWKYTKAESDWSLMTSIETPCVQKHLKDSADAKACKGFHFFAEIEKSPVGAELIGIKIIDPSYEKLRSMIVKMGKDEII